MLGEKKGMVSDMEWDVVVVGKKKKKKDERKGEGGRREGGIRNRKGRLATGCLLSNDHTAVSLICLLPVERREMRGRQHSMDQR